MTLLHPTLATTIIQGKHTRITAESSVVSFGGWRLDNNARDRFQVCHAMVGGNTGSTTNDGGRRLWGIEREDVQVGGAIKSWRSSFVRVLVLERSIQRQLLRAVLI
ncbi:hypothetical protein TSUD_288110 [Trifolium subterraneum]|uniref:Uncharacterized protein n=1 Tax=Trifolium subterraneum TaxID=3900 RepID=A0A2Z6NBL9_TRISU|nr:hypothetical protein TSUD_288110 [Trifolium subterraneum]